MPQICQIESASVSVDRLPTGVEWSRSIDDAIDHTKVAELDAANHLLANAFVEPVLQRDLRGNKGDFARRLAVFPRKNHLRENSALSKPGGIGRSSAASNICLVTPISASSAHASSFASPASPLADNDFVVSVALTVLTSSCAPLTLLVAGPLVFLVVLAAGFAFDFPVFFTAIVLLLWTRLNQDVTG
jgi:hypothetical protein